MGSVKSLIKGVDGYKECLSCKSRFAYRNSLISRGAFSRPLGIKVGHRKQKFCSLRCSLSWRNTFQNPSKTEAARLKISLKAKHRDHSHLHTEEARKKQIASITGSGHWNWQGGITPENRRRRNLKEYRDWRKKVFERDNYTCVICLVRGGYLEADHIKPWSLFPELRLRLENGRTLCRSCHKKTSTYMGRIKNYQSLGFADDG